MFITKKKLQELKEENACLKQLVDVYRARANSYMDGWRDADKKIVSLTNALEVYEHKLGWQMNWEENDYIITQHTMSHGYGLGPDVLDITLEITPNKHRKAENYQWAEPEDN